ncbi:Sorting nexin, cytoplasm-to-vacuole targeting pathway/endosomal sorting [Tulasnella sp. 403]|nr:Sorting nexin, cytoplasm-to-vacuole targeting pathway/endosomal sorting [Tulasnella sp. 403]
MSPQQARPTLSAVKTSFTLPNYAQNKVEFCCGRDQFLHSGDDAEIQIVDAVKVAEGTATPYIAYVIRTGNVEARRRYSEFDSLRNGLSKLYPTLIIPPIPSKQSISDYAVKQAKAKEDQNMIKRRQRMLQVFLNRIARHPILSNEHVFHRFIDRDVSWSEVLATPPLALLPKNILKAPAHNPLETSQAAAYQALPSPAPSQPLRRPDQRFQDSETFTNKFATHLNGSMEKVSRRTMKRWSEFANEHAELGAVLNGFSLSESGSLQAALEKTGQAVDATYTSTITLLQTLEQTWTEPLQEYVQFAAIIKRLLAYRHQKHVQYEMTQETLDAKRSVLEEYEKNEAEARRLETALSRGRSLATGDGSADGAEGEDDGENGLGTSSFATGSMSRSRSLPSSSSPRLRRTSYGFLSALSYSLHGIMDVDPEVARRNNISKTRDNISQLEDALHASAQDLKYASSTIQADLDRFQRMKVADLRDMTIAMAKIHKEWCQKNLEAWIAAKQEIDKIEPHPNQAPDDAKDEPRPGPSASRSSNGLS